MLVDLYFAIYQVLYITFTKQNFELAEEISLCFKSSIQTSQLLDGDKFHVGSINFQQVFYEGFFSNQYLKMLPFRKGQCNLLYVFYELIKTNLGCFLRIFCFSSSFLV